MVSLDRFPGGKTKALTMSYDDGREYDRRLVEIFNKYGIKGTFHLNSGFFNREGYIKSSEVKELYKGHEVSVHSLTHPWLNRIPREAVIKEIMEDRRNLESLVGYPVRGMSYPFGSYSKELMELLAQLGIEYSRTVRSTFSFHIPDNFLEWHPTCHHNGDLRKLADAFFKSSHMSLFYVWGHSYEFPAQDNWGIMEDFCSLIGNREDVWYATNIEIVDYMKALKNLRFSASYDRVYNPSAISVWVSVAGQSVEIPSGQTIAL